MNDYSATSCAARLSESHRLVPRKLEQLFDDPEIIFEQLLLYGVSYCLNQPTYVNGGEIEQENRFAKLSLGSQFQSPEIGNQHRDIRDGAFLRRARCVLATARCPFGEAYDVDHDLASAIA